MYRADWSYNISFCIAQIGAYNMSISLFLKFKQNDLNCVQHNLQINWIFFFLFHTESTQADEQIRVVVLSIY